MSQDIRITVPASTANLGSGFDSLGMALRLFDVVEISAVTGSAGSVHVEIAGEGAGSLATDARHLVIRTLHRTLAHLGVSAPALRVRCRNSIPQSRGLGSSAAAIVAGIAAGYELAGTSVHDGHNSADALQLAASIEGHADNVAASLFGGLVIAWNDSGRFHASRLEPRADLRPVALVPEVTSSTHATRGLLPETVPHADAAFAAGRAALAVQALTGDPGLLFAATEDRLHQDYREPAWPETISLIRRLRAAGVAAVVSGAGPTVLAFPLAGDLPGEVDTAGFRALSLPVDLAGVRVDRVDSGG